VTAPAGPNIRRDNHHDRWYTNTGGRSGVSLFEKQEDPPLPSFIKSEVVRDTNSTFRGTGIAAGVR
jgi:hypothetical protein